MQGPEPLFSPLAVAGVSHHRSDAKVLEMFRFEDEHAFLRRAREHFRGVVLLQTCNRVEVIVHGEADALAQFLHEQGRDHFSLLSGVDALRHLLEVACGVDSMIVGEDQILGQIRTALATSLQAGSCDNFLEVCLTKAVHTGADIRQRTQINRGALSVGSAAVLLAEKELGSLENRHILVIGSGEMGMLVAQALAEKRLTAIYVANRTYARAVTLAGKIGGKAVRLQELGRYLTLSDVVITCTSAPHPVIRASDLRKVMKGRCWPLDGHPRPLMVIDIAQPRDVEEEAGGVDGVKLFTIDNLRDISEATLSSRKAAAETANVHIEEEMNRSVRLLNRTAADDTLAQLYTWAEAVRLRERDKAIARLPAGEEKTPEIIEDLSRVLVNKLLADATMSIRQCAEAGNLAAAESLVQAITRGEHSCFRKEG